MKKIFLFIFLFTLSTNLFAKENLKTCPEVLTHIKKLYKKDSNLNTETYFEIFNYGFFLQETYDFKNNKLVFKRTNGYPIVSTFLDLDLYNQKKIKSGDIIIKINNKNASKFNQEALDNIFYSNKESNPRKKLKIEFLENKTKKKIILNLEKKKYSYHLSEPIFQINSINDIDTVKGNFEINYIFSYDSIHPALGKIIKKFDLFENSQCPVTGDEIDELSVGQTEFLFLNRAKVSNDEIKNNYYLSLEDPKDNQSKLTNAVVTSEETGVAKFRSNFNFKKFPLDEQTLKISIMEMYGLLPNPKRSLQLLNSETQYKLLKNYFDKNILKEWEIKSYNINFKTSNLIGYTLPSTQIDITLNIKRNVLYYLIKIILPIFLILSLAWYVFWIHPKELESRITTSIVCFLALIAYNFVIDSEIPKLGYLTFMDWIIMLSYIFCALPTAISITLNHYIESKIYNVIEINNYIRFLGPIMYFTMLIIVGFFILL